MEKKHPIEDVDIYGEQVREVLSKPPNWLTMTGSSIVFALLLSFLFLSYLIKYPDVLSAKVTITSQTPPANIIAKVNGKIEKIFVTDNSEVVKEQQLAIIENAARLDHVEALKTVLYQIEPDFYNPREINFSNDFELGDLQSAYSVFTHDYAMLKSHNKINAKNKQVSILRKQLSEYQELIKKQTSQQLNLENEQSILNKDWERSRKLYTNGVISLRDLEEKQKESLRIKRNIDNLLIEKSNSQIAISNIERSVSDAQSNDGSTVEQLRTKTFESYQNLINQIKTWEQTYILKSPIDGKITYFSFWSENQNIKQGEDMFSIIPKDQSDRIGKVLLPIQNTGKLKIGQQAIIKLDNYPSPEFGVLIGTVEKISSIPKQNNYAVEIKFEQPLKTTLGKEIEHKDEAQGSIEVVTEDLRLIERIFYQIRKLFN